jgi:perosamine synthetase
MARFYNNQLAEVKELQLPVEKPYAKNVYWMYHIVLSGSLKNKRNILMAALKEKGIETRESFIPYNGQDFFIKQGLAEKTDCPIANVVGDNGFYLPSGPTLSEEEMFYVTDNIKKIINEHK